MNKSNLIADLAKKNAYLPYIDCKKIVSVIFDEMSEALSKKQRVELRGFGAFFTRQKPPRQARNPRTGESLQIKETTSVHFRAGKKLREQIDNKNSGKL